MHLGEGKLQDGRKRKWQGCRLGEESDKDADPGGKMTSMQIGK